MLAVVAAESGDAVAGARAELTDATEGEIALEAAADDEGAMTLSGLDTGTYTLTVAAEGYLAAVRPVTYTGSSLEERIELVATVAAPPTPAPTATPSSEAPTATPAPPTSATSTPPPPQPTPAPAAAGPLGANLLLNPGFEQGSAHWFRHGIIGAEREIKFISTNDYPFLIHSGQHAAFTLSEIVQRVEGVTPGQTYRLGAWVRLWASPGEDRTTSQPVDDIYVMVCIHPEGKTYLDGAICSGHATPYDTWQYISVDAYVNKSTIAAHLVLMRSQDVRAEAYWDDVSLSTSSVSITPTPEPAPPTRAEAAPFDGVALRDHIIGARRDVEQIGGLLDRLTSGEEGSCEEFERHYQQLHTHPPYHSVPEAWMGAYNEYNWAVQNGIDTSQSIYSLCTGGGGSLTYLNYSVARQGVNDSVSHFIAALEMANALLEP